MAAIVMGLPLAAYMAAARQKQQDNWQEIFNAQKEAAGEADIVQRLQANYLTEQTLPASISAINAAAGSTGVRYQSDVDAYQLQLRENSLKNQVARDRQNIYDGNLPTTEGGRVLKDTMEANQTEAQLQVAQNKLALANLTLGGGPGIPLGGTMLNYPNGTAGQLGTVNPANPDTPNTPNRFSGLGNLIKKAELRPGQYRVAPDGQNFEAMDEQGKIHIITRPPVNSEFVGG